MDISFIRKTLLELNVNTTIFFYGVPTCKRILEKTKLFIYHKTIVPEESCPVEPTRRNQIS